MMPGASSAAYEGYPPIPQHRYSLNASILRPDQKCMALSDFQTSPKHSQRPKLKARNIRMYVTRTEQMTRKMSWKLEKPFLEQWYLGK